MRVLSIKDFKCFSELVLWTNKKCLSLMTHWLTEIMMTQAATMIHAKYLLWKFGCWNTRVEYRENNSRTYEKIKYILRKSFIYFWNNYCWSSFRKVVHGCSHPKSTPPKITHLLEYQYTVLSRPPQNDLVLFLGTRLSNHRVLKRERKGMKTCSSEFILLNQMVSVTKNWVPWKCFVPSYSCLRGFFIWTAIIARFPYNRRNFENPP